MSGPGRSDFILPKGNRGRVRSENRVINQKGEIVLAYNPLRMMKRRGSREGQG